MKPIPKHEGPVLVQWLDSGYSSGWQPVADIEPEVMVCNSVGWITASNRECLVLISHLIEPNSRAPKQGCGDMTIPRAAILNILPLARQRGGNRRA
jgi:hypothetical protein